MANITEYLRQIQTLTNKNLELLKAINESFNSKKSYLSVSIDGADYKIPSFLALESRITDLQENLLNLADAPKTGMAAFNFNGNTQKIELCSFENTPTPVSLTKNVLFDVKSNDLFKDMLSPIPYVRFGLGSLPDDILKVNVRKIVLKSDDCITNMKSFLEDETTVKEVKYQDIIDALTVFTKDTDYEIYNKIYDMPVRDNSKYGVWTINTIDKNWTDNETLDEYYTLTMNEDLYTTDEAGNKVALALGDYVICNSGKTKLQVVSDPKMDAKQITVKVLNGSYSNLIPLSKGQADLSTLTYYTSPDYYNYKYVDVPLEEDNYVFIFIDSINGLNVKSVLSSGLFYNTANLVLNGTETSDIPTTYSEYYKNISNIGDKLQAMTSMFKNGLNVYTQAQFETITSSKPDITDEAGYFKWAVKQINNHLNNSETCKNIRTLYAQKQSNKTQLAAVQNEIADLNNIINSIDFNDTTGMRETYTKQLVDKQAEYQSLSETIKSLTTQIADDANNSVTPIENAKYHIRGFIDVEKIANKLNAEIASNQKDIVPIRLEIQYRYRNSEGTTGNAMSISDDLLYSDWTIMDAPYRKQIVDADNYVSYKWEDYNNTENTPSFNQVDIPITQGEVVDIKVSIVYDLCYPFAVIQSDFSDIYTVEFPEELQKDIEILDIINENNDEVKQYAFDNILTKYGIQDHVGNSVVDNNTTFWHQADNITSGFYTDEQRVISLKEKLNDMNNLLTEVRDDVYGTNSNKLTCVLSNSKHSITLNDNDENIFVAQDFVNNSNIVKYSPDIKYSNAYSSTDLITDRKLYFSAIEPTGTETPEAYIYTLFITITGLTDDEISNIPTPAKVKLSWKELKLKYSENGKTFTCEIDDASSNTYYDVTKWETFGSDGIRLKFYSTNKYDGLLALFTSLWHSYGLKESTPINVLGINGSLSLGIVDADEYKDSQYAYDRLNLQIQNNSSNSMKIYPLFRGNPTDTLKYKDVQYTAANNYGKLDGGIGIYTKDEDIVYQRYNQLLYFRLFDPYKASATNESNWYYNDGNVGNNTSLQSEEVSIRTEGTTYKWTNTYSWEDNSIAVWKFEKPENLTDGVVLLKNATAACEAFENSDDFETDTTSYSSGIYIRSKYKYNLIVLSIPKVGYRPQVQLKEWYAGDTKGNLNSILPDKTANANLYPGIKSANMQVYIHNDNNDEYITYSNYEFTNSINFNGNDTKYIVEEPSLKSGSSNTPFDYFVSGGTIYYGGGAYTQKATIFSANNLLSYDIESRYRFKDDFDNWTSDQLTEYNEDVNNGAFLYPYVNSMSDIQLKTNNSRYFTLNAGESLQLGLMFEYKLQANHSIEKTIAFEVRTSLYDEPHLYIVTVKSEYETNAQYSDTTTNRYNTVVQN